MSDYLSLADFGRCEKCNQAIRLLPHHCPAETVLVTATDHTDDEDEERDDSPYCDCGNFPTEEESAFNSCSCCGKRIEP